MRRPSAIFVVAALVIAGAVAVSFWRARPVTVGAKLVHGLEAQGASLRGALPVMDYRPDPVVLAADLGRPVRRGAGSLPGQGMSLVKNQRWLKGADFEFVWQAATGKTPLPQPLRGALTPDAPAPKALARALSDAGYFPAAVNANLGSASRDLLSLSDEDLFLAWLGADRAVMAESENLSAAVREGLLLLARANNGPAIVFTAGNARIYLLPLDAAASTDDATVWTQLEAFKDGHLCWSGILTITGSPAPKRVRQNAAQVANEIEKPRAAESMK